MTGQGKAGDCQGVDGQGAQRKGGGEEHPHHFSFQISLNGGVRGDFGLYLLAVSCGESAAKTELLFVAFCGVLRHIPRRFLRSNKVESS